MRFELLSTVKKKNALGARSYGQSTKSVQQVGTHVGLSTAIINLGRYCRGVADRCFKNHWRRHRDRSRSRSHHWSPTETWRPEKCVNYPKSCSCSAARENAERTTSQTRYIKGERFEGFRD